MSELTRNILRFCGRLLLFVCCWAAFYLAVLRLVVPRLPKTVLARTTIPERLPVGFSRLMVAEADTVSPVDILFVGSSHAYETFDPRFFAKYGIRTFNLASLGESPIQSYYMQERYLRRLHPKLVVLEIWWPRLADDGAESALDLISNLPMSFGLLRMTLATHNVEVYNAFLSRLVNGEHPERVPAPREMWGLRYVGGGFAERIHDATFTGLKRTFTYQIDPRELRYLKRIVADVRASGARPVLVVQPVSSLMLGRITNLQEIDVKVNKFADELGVQYIDFNKVARLDPHLHFDTDGHHLNGLGVNAFLPQFLPELQRRGFLQGIRSPFTAVATRTD